MVDTMLKNFEEWYEKVKRACQSHDSDIAYSAWRQWDEMVTQAPDLSQNEILRLKEKLYFTAFPSLPTDQAVNLVESQLLNLLVSEVDIDEVIQNRFLYLGYGNQEDDRKALQSAVLQNKQTFGGKMAGEWVQNFDKSFPLEERDETAIATFFTQAPEITAMSKNDQGILQKLLRVYDQWFALPVVTIYDTAIVLQKIDELEKKGVKEIDLSTFKSQHLVPFGGRQIVETESDTKKFGSTTQHTVRLPLLQALSKYEQLGNQLITEERLKLKSQTETVRPSLLYWIKYYRDELGVGHHSSVDRGNFLFRSENGKKLTPEERERVNLVLRSVEENVPLDIDTEQSIILFPAFVAPTPTPRPTLPPMAPQRPAFQPSGSAVFQPAQPTAQPGAMSFSSKHVLPAEKAASEAPVSTPAPRPVVAPRPATPVAPKRNPFHIRPVSMGKEEE